MPTRILISTLLACVLIVMDLSAQNYSPVFKDGIYASYDDFINNNPTISFNGFDIKWGDSKFFNQLKIKEIQKRNVKKKKDKRVDGNSYWGICVGGIPYIQYGFGSFSKIYFGNQAGSKNGKANFTRIRIIGNICHFNVEDFISSENTLSSALNSYIPSEGKLVREQKIMKLSTGQVADFNENAIMAFIKDDFGLYSHFVEADSREAKIFLYLQKYNERNPLVVAR